jgi:hypothetical protein
MPTRIEMLKQAGFSDAEIGDWATAERQRMQEQGFRDDEIDNEFGVTRPPNEVPEAFIERLKQGNAAQRIAGAAGDYAQRYFGEEPLGFSEKNQEFLRRLGVIGNIAIPAAKPVDAVLRAVPAGIAAVGAGVGQALEEAEDAALGPGGQAKGKAARDFAELAQIAAMLSGAGRGGRMPAPRITAAPAIVLPRAEDFRNAAAAISGTPASFSTEQKLLRLWKEHGIAPAEVAQDARRDRTISADLLSDSGKLPEAYVGVGKETASATGEPGAPAQAAPRSDHPAPAAEDPAGATAEEAPLLPGTDAPPPAPRIAQSRDVSMYAPPRMKNPRPFQMDYRRPPVTDSAGRLLQDIEGRPLGAKYVVGRQFAGKRDVPLTPEEIKSALTDLDIRLVEMPELPMPDPNTGAVFAGELSGWRPVGDLFVKNTLSKEDQNLMLAHEFGHAIDHYADYFSDHLTPAEIDELRGVYTTLRAGPRKTRVPQPEDFGYPPDEVNGELAAEGFRAYLTNPNWFKAVAPRSAARFRAAVNKNKYLKHVIQFNSLGAAGLLSAGAGRGDQNNQ